MVLVVEREQAHQHITLRVVTDEAGGVMVVALFRAGLDDEVRVVLDRGISLRDEIRTPRVIYLSEGGDDVGYGT